MLLVTSLRKPDVFSVIVDPTRNSIIRRLSEAGKAAYSDLLDSAEYVKHLTSTGNFNYHLNFLLDISVIVKDGTVYKLTERGQEVARFIKDVDKIWSKLESTLRGERTSIFSFAEQFEEETGTKMQKVTTKFHGIELIVDERKVIGLFAQEDCNKEFFAQYEPITIKDFELCLRECEKKRKKIKELVVSHPDLEYHLSIQMLGVVFQFLENNFGVVHVFAVKKKQHPFLFRAAEMRKDYNGCAFIVAPCVF
jgi:DNA-binding transcriptional ArsR family regulator